MSYMSHFPKCLLHPLLVLPLGVQRGGTNHFMPHLPPAGKFCIFRHPSDRARVV